MSANRTERLLNLVICLLATRRWLTKDQVRHAVPQYTTSESPEAFDRMFERDKEDLKELGIPLVTGTDSTWFDDETGYRIDRDAYALPEIEFTAPEMAVLGLASKVWQEAGLAGPAARAMTKLRALGVETDDDTLVGVEPRIRTAEPAFAPLYTATRDKTPVTFQYRKPRDQAPATRHLQPWGLANRGRWWYVVGHDLDRDAARVFRLSRIHGAVRRTGPRDSYQIPEGLDLHQILAGPDPTDTRTATLRIRHDRCAALRLRAATVGPTDPDGWQELHLTIHDPDLLAEQIASAGPDAVLLTPQDLRSQVLERLRAVRRAHPCPVP
jgi:proteasome accessory factor B